MCNCGEFMLTVSSTPSSLCKYQYRESKLERIEEVTIQDVGLSMRPGLAQVEGGIIYAVPDKRNELTCFIMGQSTDL